MRRTRRIDAQSQPVAFLLCAITIEHSNESREALFCTSTHPSLLLDLALFARFVLRAHHDTLTPLRVVRLLLALLFSAHDRFRASAFRRNPLLDLLTSSSVLPTHDRSPSPNKLRTQPSMSTLHGMSYELQSLEDQVQNKREWKYEMRREAQEILPGASCASRGVRGETDGMRVTGLFVGPFQPSWKLEVLQSLGITHILCIAETREQCVPAFLPTLENMLTILRRHILKPKFPEHFVYLIQDIRDADDQNLIRIFPQCASPLLPHLFRTDERRAQNLQLH